MKIADLTLRELGATVLRWLGLALVLLVYLTLLL